MFDALFFQPILALLTFIYQRVAFYDLGIAIIGLTLVIRVVLLPFFYKSAKDQALMRKLQPYVDEIKQKHKHDREKQGQALMTLYREHKLNPFSSFFVIIVQLPIFFALFKLFRNSEFLIETFHNTTLIGLVSLGETSIILTVAAGALQYVQGILSIGKSKEKKQPTQKEPLKQFGKTMIYVAPALTFFILINLPAALALYWVASTLFSVGQQIIINRKLAPINIKENDGPNTQKNKNTRQINRV